MLDDKYQQILYENKLFLIISRYTFVININRYCTKTCLIPLAPQDVQDKYQQILYENALLQPYFSLNCLR